MEGTRAENQKLVQNPKSSISHSVIMHIIVDITGPLSLNEDHLTLSELLRGLDEMCMKYLLHSLPHNSGSIHSSIY